MKLDSLSRDEITQLNLGTGVPIIYRFNEDGSVVEKRDMAKTPA
jgi:2,3-bisphosphoglycerate-dependent phosphoglycerate mutase